MTRMILLATALSVATAWGVDLKNEDSKGYDVRVSSGASSTSTSIAANTVQKQVCSGTCEIEVSGAGKVKASGSETVVIKDGKLSKK